MNTFSLPHKPALSAAARSAGQRLFNSEDALRSADHCALIVQGAIDEARAAKLPALKTYLYRTLDSDQDGDPYDHGVLKAADLKDATQLLSERFTTLGFGTSTVYLYETDVSKDRRGVCGSEPRQKVRVRARLRAGLKLN